MKTMKNVLMILLGAALVLSLAGVGAVSAEKEVVTTSGGTGSITVTYTISDKFTVTIPSNVVIGGAAATPLEATNVLLNPGQILTVTVHSDKGWELVHQSSPDDKLKYQMTYKIGDVSKTVSSGDEPILTLRKSTTSSTVEFAYALVESVDISTAAAGTYADTLTFTVAVSGTTEQN